MKNAKGNRITHRISIESVEQVDEFVEKWLRTAYEADETVSVRYRSVASCSYQFKGRSPLFFELETGNWKLSCYPLFPPPGQRG